MDEQRTTRTPSEVSGTPQEIDVRTDRTWRAFQMRLEAWTLLPPAKQAETARAAAVLGQLFGDEGLGFLTSPYPEQRNQMKNLLERIEAEDLTDELVELAGAPFVDCLRSETKTYDAMVTRSLRSTEGATDRLDPHLRKINETIVRFAAAVIGDVDLDDPKSEKAAYDMLAPIRNARAKANQAMAATRAKDKKKPAAADAPAPAPGTSTTDGGADAPN